LSTIPGSGLRPVDPTVRAAVAALARALELNDPALARRAAFRAAVVNHTAATLGLGAEDRAATLAAAMLAETAALITHARPTDEADAAAAVLAAVLAERVGVGAATAAALRSRLERWDGTGAPHGLAGDTIPLPARIVAVAHLLVGPIEAGGTPHWTARAGRVRSLAGTALDPTLATAITDHVLAVPMADTLLSLDAALATLDELATAHEPSTPIEALTSIGAAIHAADRIDDVIALIAEHARRALRAASVSIARLDHDDGSLQVLVNVGELLQGQERFPADQIVPLDDLPTFTAFRTGEAHALSCTDTAPDDPEARYLRARGAYSEIAVPIVVGETPWGAVWAATRAGRRELDEQDLGTLRLVATQIAAGVTQAIRVADLEALALRDPLTGLGNRRVLDAKLRTIFARPPIARQDTAVIICDVDHLKVVNDTLGHAAGDAVLLEAADALRLAVVGISDATVCRIGGDEFCVVIDGQGLLLAQPVAERAQRLFARVDTRSMSCGVAVATVDMHTPGDLLRAADQAQYLQKRDRRGDVVGHDEGDHARRRYRDR
jgi:diguanylate cyclase (GGDEF)-like protein